MKGSRAARKPVSEVDMQQLLNALFRKLWLIGVVAVMFAMLSFMFTYLFIPPQYSSYVAFYVNNNAITVDDVVKIRYSDISASKSLVDSYTTILLTRQTLTDVTDYAGVDRTCQELRQMIEAGALGGTEVYRVIVNSTDPEEAYKLAAAIEYVLPNRISAIIEGSSAKVVDSAMISMARISPNYSQNTMIGFVIGAVLVILLIIIRTTSDTTVRHEEDIAKYCAHPILTAVPDMASLSRGGYYGYGDTSKSITERVSSIVRPKLVGSGISFAASEAYKLLRTKLLFSFTEEKSCYVIGVSSALAGEGKSLTSVNLAYSMSQLGKKVLLVDCDMRRPSLSVKLPVAQEPGLSNYLSGRSQLDGLIQPCGIPEEENCFQVLAAGPNPPNPVELLSSERIEQLLEILRQSYDYVILDFPPVGEVSDALSVTKQADGMLLVVRQNYCDRNVLHAVARQFSFMGAKILGVVYNCASEGNGVYRKKYYQYAKYAGSYYRAQKNEEKQRISE